ncbi:MAG: epoxyqueuosine reductase QueH [Oscillospiraceae bacterium]|nr:epoxyqueuosine reductase QueH [Oscillospiraceae bacterium]
MSDKKKLLLHVCCAPCACYVIELLAAGNDITLLFYNPCIEPFDEYLKRKVQLQILLSNLPEGEHIRVLDCEYRNEDFVVIAEGLRGEPEGGARCASCFELRLSETARLAKLHGFEVFATTLTVSVHKDAAMINEIGEKLSNSYDVAYLSSDFKKLGGYQRSIVLSRQLGLYRQNYCGCAI